MSKKREPSYLLHKATGQARVRISGNDHHLGEHVTAENRERGVFAALTVQTRGPHRTTKIPPLATVSSYDD